MKKISMLILVCTGVALTGCSQMGNDAGDAKITDVSMDDIKEKGEKKTVDGKEVIEYKTEDGGVIQMDPEAMESGTSMSIGQ
ncbi:hypothetical protein JNUCC83_08775 [Vagococcus sp. JNUCC 83]